MLQQNNSTIVDTVPRRAHPLAEASRALGISKATIYRHAVAGKIRLIHIGSRTLVPESEIVRLTTEGMR